VRSARRPRRHIFIDIRPRLRYHPHRIPACEGRRPATPADGAGAVPAGAGSSPALPGGFGATPGRHYDRPARSSLDWDRKLRVPGSASGAELRRWLAAASAAVERRQAARRVDFVCADLRTLVCVDARRAPSSVLPRTRGRMKVEARRLEIRVCRRSASFSFCSPDERSEIRGRRCKPRDRSRISLRFTRGTNAHPGYGSDFAARDHGDAGPTAGLTLTGSRSQRFPVLGVGRTRARTRSESGFAFSPLPAHG
jgi:hypothetical protein